MWVCPRLCPVTPTPADESSAIELRYEDGTIRIDGLEESSISPSSLRTAVPDLETDQRTDGFRVPAFQYAALCAALAETDAAVDDRVLDLESVSALESAYELRGYQTTALETWLKTDRWAGGPAESIGRAPAGVLELPTGSGKTVIALAAIERLSVPTLVVADDRPARAVAARTRARIRSADRPLRRRRTALRADHRFDLRLGVPES